MTLRSLGAVSFVVCLLAPATAHAQGRGGPNWTTYNSDAQRTASIRTDPRISTDSVSKPGVFQLIWKTRLENQSRQMNSLTQPLLLNNIISYKGFKALAFVGGSADNVWSIDYELNRMFWARRLNPGSTGSGTPQCPGGLTAITRVTPLPQATPAPTPAPARVGGPAGLNLGMNLAAAVYAISGAGMVHVLNPQTGEDLSPPVKFLAPNAKVLGSVFVDGMLYAATADNCGNVASGVWTVEPGSEAKAIRNWTAGKGTVVGNAAPTLGADGTVYVATTGGEVVALQARSLTPSGVFTAGTPFTTGPIAFSYKNRAVVVAGNSDGRLYVLDAAGMTAVSRSEPVAATAPNSGLATWEDSDGTRWVLASAGTKVLAFRFVDRNGTPALQQAWSSRDIATPAPPIVINGVVFALASGGPRSGPAVLYAIDGRSGKDLWNSGSAITSFVRSGGLSGGDGQVYVPTYDNTLYAFGIPLEH
ncbi:MAG: hypothetical protein ND807_17455 [Vicinamibacterales bacterium]|nr:hypothetical protein [Vicinamibacterales bacterium]